MITDGGMAKRKTRSWRAKQIARAKKHRVPLSYARDAIARGVDPVRSWLATMWNRARRRGIPREVAREAIARRVDPVRSLIAKAARKRSRERIEHERRIALGRRALELGASEELVAWALERKLDPIALWERMQSARNARQEKASTRSMGWPSVPVGKRRGSWISWLMRHARDLARSMDAKVRLKRVAKFRWKLRDRVGIYIDDAKHVSAAALARAFQKAYEKLQRRKPRTRKKLQFRFSVVLEIPMYLSDEVRSRPSLDKTGELEEVEHIEVPDAPVRYMVRVFRSQWFKQPRLSEVFWLNFADRMGEVFDWADEAIIESVVLEATYR